MSHFSKIKTRIKDKKTLVIVLKQMGYQIQEGGKIEGFEGHMDVDFSAKIGQGYDIGFIKDKNGNYEIIADWWGIEDSSEASFQRKFDRELKAVEMQVKREYALEKVLEKTNQENFDLIEKEVEKDGSIRLLLRRWV